jgi:type IV fimbrial biogenesis protein FimT
MKPNPPRARGFTLIELMVTLAIAAVLLVTGIPSMLAYKRNADLTSASNTLFAAINAARGEAMKRGMFASIVPTGNGSDWAAGWVVFIDTNQDGVYDASGDTIVLQQPAMQSYLSVTGSGAAADTPPYIMFDSSGFIKTKIGTSNGLTLEMKYSDGSGTVTPEQTRFVKIAKTGRARVCKPASSSDTNCNLAGAY